MRFPNYKIPNLHRDHNSVDKVQMVYYQFNSKKFPSATAQDKGTLSVMLAHCTRSTTCYNHTYILGRDHLSLGVLLTCLPFPLLLYQRSCDFGQCGMTSICYHISLPCNDSSNKTQILHAQPIQAEHFHL